MLVAQTDSLPVLRRLPEVKAGLLTSHPIQYHAPWFRALAHRLDIEVFFSHRPTAAEQAVGFGGSFEWDIDLLSGYRHTFLRNVSSEPATNTFFGCDTPDIATLVNRIDALIVTGWNLKTFWQGIRAARRQGVPVLVRGDSQLRTPRNPVKRGIKKIAYPILLKQFDAFLSVGKRNEEYLRHYRVPSEQIFFVPHFVDNEWFRQRARNNPSQRESQRSCWRVAPQTTVALFVGKFVEKKRPADLIAALKILQDISGDFVGVFVGSGILESHLRADANEAGIRVVFEGFRNQSELPRFYSAADVLVLPSDGGETWGLVVNEAMACGLPAIVSAEVGCAPDMIDEGSTGFTFPMGDPFALSERLSRISKLRRNGFDFKRSLEAKVHEYSIEAAVEGTLHAIRYVMSAKHVPPARMSAQ